MVRRDLEKKMTEAYRILDNFSWEPEDIGQIMLWIQESEGRFPYEMALRWMRANPEEVESRLR